MKLPMRPWEKCSTCTQMRRVFKHPWNQNEWAKGTISEQIGTVCILFTLPEFDNSDKVIFSDRDGTCECWMPCDLNMEDVEETRKGEGVILKHIPTGKYYHSDTEETYKENYNKAQAMLAVSVRYPDR